MSSVTIALKDVSLTIPTFKSSSELDMRQTILRAVLGGNVRRSKDGMLHVRALDRVNLTVRDGERVGLVGHNGAGKTTLLKVIAGVLPITSGNMFRRGDARSFFTYGAGLDYNCTGRQNITAMALYYTQDMKLIAREVDSIIAFTELEHYIDLPVATYSLGMVTRLMFAVATAFPSNIICLDELISAGDAAFMMQAKERLEQLLAESGTLVLASHSIETIKSMCNRVVWMDHGTVRMDGDPDEVCDAYFLDVCRVVRERQEAEAALVAKSA